MHGNTYAAARGALETGETSCEALVSCFLDRIEKHNAKLNAFLRVNADEAMKRAFELDRGRANGEYGPLTGMVIGVKDVICRKDHTVTCGSRMLSEFKSLYSATAVERLQSAGAIVIGATNCDEFAMGSSNESSFFGPVQHPEDNTRVPGGSSGGSAAAVAAGMCHAALGTDTGGSIRQPAAFCGVVGLKPTYGRVSRHGLVAYASSFDCIGPITHSIEDAAHVLAAISGKDVNDSTSRDAESISTVIEKEPSLEGVRVGLPKEFMGDGLDGGIRRAVEEAAAALASAGAQIEEVSLPRTQYGIAAYYVLVTAEASSNLARYDGVRYGYRAREVSERSGRLSLREMYERTRSEGFGDEVKRRIMLGTYVLSAGYYEDYYARAGRVRQLIRDDFDSAFERVHVLLTPTTPTTAFRLGDKMEDPLQMYLSDVYTVTANLAGIPGLSIPFGTDRDGLPIGIQLLGPVFRENVLLRVGRAIERSVPVEDG